MNVLKHNTNRLFSSQVFLFLKHSRNYAKKLSSDQTSTALRPFYFIVHPDLFGRYPKAREVNEDSLKILNEYINALQTYQKVRPVSLLFYVRSNPSVKREDAEGPLPVKDQDILRTVRVSLLSDNICSTVKSILRSCDLPLDYLNSVKCETNKDKGSSIGKPDRPIKWDPSFYEFYGIPNPYEQKSQREKTINTLSSWLHKNLDKAKKYQTTHKGIREDVTRLKGQLKSEHGLVSITWSSSWGLNQYRASLRGLLRVIEENKTEVNLEGKSIIFGHGNGICLRGNIIVKSDDLADSWIHYLKSVTVHSAVLKKLPGYENILSHLLNNVNVVRRVGSSFILAEEYLNQLRQLSNSLEKYFIEKSSHKLLTGDLRDVDLVVECAEGPLHISPSGQILVPSSCPAFLIVDYLNDNAETARHMKAEFQKKNIIVQQLIKECKKEQDLESLDKEPNITSEQMEMFCNKLLKNLSSIHSLSGCRIKVALFYSVMSDGEMYIPWNWKSEYDTD